MSYLAVNPSGIELIFHYEPVRRKESNGFITIEYWFDAQFARENESEHDGAILLPNGTIEKLIGKKLSWKDEPIELIIKHNVKETIHEIVEKTVNEIIKK